MVEGSDSSNMSSSDLDQRVEDLEDLIMVESAGIQELKNLMQGINDKLESQGTPTEASQAPEIPEDLKDKLAAIDDIRSSIADLEKKLAAIDDIRSSIADLEKKTGSIQESFDQRPSGDFSSLKGNLSTLESRFDIIESVTRNISDEIQDVKSMFNRFESFDKLTGLSKELRKKMDEFKLIETEVRRISNQVEGFYQNLDKRLDMIREFEKAFPEVKHDLKMLRQDLMKKLDENKVLILDRATKDETSELRSRLSDAERKSSEVNPVEMNQKFNAILKSMNVMRDGLNKVGGMDIDQKLDDLRESINQRFSKVEDEMNEELANSHEPLSVVKVELSDIMSRIVAIETRIGNIEVIIQKPGKIGPIILE